MVSVGGESEVHGYDNAIFEVSSDSYFLGSNSSSSADLLKTEWFSDLSVF